MQVWQDLSQGRQLESFRKEPSLQLPQASGALVQLLQEELQVRHSTPTKNKGDWQDVQEDVVPEQVLHVASQG